MCEEGFPTLTSVCVRLGIPALTVDGGDAVACATTYSDAQMSLTCDALIAASRAFGQTQGRAGDVAEPAPSELTLVKMAFKRYAYFAAQPALRWWSTGRVPDVSLANVAVTWRPELAVTFEGRTARAAVLPMNDAVRDIVEGELIVADEAALLTYLRATLLTAHLEPLAAELAARYRIGVTPFAASIAGSVYAFYLDSLDHPGEADDFYLRSRAVLATFGPTYEKLVSYTVVFDAAQVAHHMPVRGGCCMAYQWEQDASGEPRYCLNCRLIPTEQLRSRLGERGLSLIPPDPSAAPPSSDFDPSVLLERAQH